MSNSKEGLSGLVVHEVESSIKGKTGWITHNIIFEDGASHKVAVPPDVTYEPKKGDSINLKKGPYGWILDTQPAKRGGTPNNGKSSKSSRSSSSGSSTEYWENKTSYEQDIRDPKIEFQNYLDKVMTAYCTFVPQFAASKQPKTVEEVDDIIDQAFAKARELYDRINPPADDGEEEDSEG